MYKGKQRRFEIFISLFFLILLASVIPSYGAEKVTIALPSFSFAHLPPKVAEVNGYYKEEGFDAQIITVRTAIAIKALLTDDIQFTTAIGTTMRAATTNIPVKGVMILNDKPVHVLLAKPHYKNVKDLKGKTIALSEYGSTSDYNTRAILRGNNMDPDKDVKFIVITESGVRYQSLLAGVIDAALFPPPFSFVLEDKGFSKLASASDYLEMAISGVGIADKKLKENPAQVKRMLRALFKAILFMIKNREDTVKIAAKWLKIDDKTMAGRSVDVALKTLSKDGTASDRAINFDVEATKKTLNIKEDIPLSKVVDFSIMKEVYKELAGK